MTPAPRPWRFILASASPARLELLRSVGVEPDRIVSGVDEDEEGVAAEVAAALARKKALHVAASTGGDALVLGCDSVLELDGHVLGKPRDPHDAVARWHAMRGRSGVLHTGHCLVEVAHGEVAATHEEAVATTVRFGTPTDDEVVAYVRTGEPLRCAGAFTIDGYGRAFVDGVDGDPSNVIGLSLPALRRLLAATGRSVTDWW